MRKGTSIHDAIPIDSDGEPAASQPPAKKRKVGPFVMSSDTEEDNVGKASDLVQPIIAKRIADAKTEKQPQDPQPTAEIVSLGGLLLSDSIPALLIPAQHRRDLITLFRSRLRDAGEDGVSLADVTLGEDCLPTWPGRQRGDPQSIRREIELRLWAHELPNLLRDDIRDKLRKQLEQAKAQGTAVEHVRIRKDVRLVWGEDRGRLDTTEDERSGAECRASIPPSPRASSSAEMQSPHLPTPSASSFDYDADQDTDAESSDSEDPETDASSSALDDKSTVDRSDTCSSASESESESESESASGTEQDIMDTENPPNIFHDAQVVGGPPHLQTMDFEVYLASSDSDLDGLPEVEFAIDRDAYEFHHPEAAAEAFDIDIPEGSTLRSTDEHMVCHTTGEDDADQRPQQGGSLMPRWASPTVVLEALKKKHWGRMCKADRDRWEAEIEAAGKGALDVVDGKGGEVEMPDEVESEVSVEDESEDDRALRAGPGDAGVGEQDDGSGCEAEGDVEEVTGDEDSVAMSGNSRGLRQWER